MAVIDMLQYHLEMCVYSSKFLDKGLLNEKVKPLLLFDNMGRLYHLSLNNNVESAFFHIASEIMCFQDLGFVPVRWKWYINVVEHLSIYLWAVCIFLLTCLIISFAHFFFFGILIYFLLFFGCIFKINFSINPYQV